MRTVPAIIWLFLTTPLFWDCNHAPIEVIPDYTWIDRLDTSINTSGRAKIRFWIDSTGLTNLQLESAFKLYTPHKDLYNALLNAKSVYHQRVLIDDRVSAIPGISQGSFVANGLPRTMILTNPVDSVLSLPAAEAPNFTDATYINLTVGTKIYRVIGGSGSYPTGGYWVDTKPTNYAEIIGGTAVQPEWNGFNEIVEFTVPASGMKVWKGKAAAQPIASAPNKFVTTYSTKYNLSGGGNQLFVPNVYRDFRDSVAYNRFLSNITNKETITWKKN
ncbi:MAG: hypothetical protein RIS64_3270 [Bacteroidota bacterium]|jgi:hypothetical protein